MPQRNDPFDAAYNEVYGTGASVRDSFDEAYASVYGGDSAVTPSVTPTRTPVKAPANVSRPSWISTQVRSTLGGLAQTGFGTLSRIASALDVVTPEGLRSNMGPRFEQMGQSLVERLSPEDEQRRREYQSGVAGAALASELLKYGGVGRAATQVPQLVSSLGRRGAAAAGGFGLGAAEDVGTRPEQSLAAIGGQGARAMGAERAAGALESMAQTPVGRALVGATAGAIPEAALSIGSRGVRQVRGTTPQVTPRTTPETDPSRLLPSTTERIGPVAGPPIPMRGEVEPEDVARRLAEAAAKAGLPVDRPLIEVVESGARTPQQQAAYRRSIRKTAEQLEREARRQRALPTPDMDAIAQLEAAAEAGRRLNAPSGLILRSGVIAPELLAQGGGAILGGTAGVATAPEDEDVYGLGGRFVLGAAAGAGLGRAALRRGTAKFTSPPSSPSVQRVRETINAGDRATTEAPAWLTPKERAYTDFFSETFPLVKAARTAGVESRMQGLIAQLHGHERAAFQFLEDQLGQTFRGSKDIADDVRTFLKARRDLDIRTRGGAAKSAASLEDLQAAVTELSANPRVVAAADAVNDMHRDLLTKRFEAGLLTENAYRAIINSEDYYTPFVREFAEESVARGSAGGRFSVGTSGVNRMDRTVESIANTADPLEVAMAAAQRTYRDVAKQRLQNLVTELADAGQMPFVRRVEGTAKPGAMTYRQMVNGKPVLYEVTDRDMYDVLTGVDALSQNILARIARSVTQIGRASITLLPDFAVANVIRDIGQTAPQRSDITRAAREMAMGAGVGSVAGAATTDEDESLLQNMLVGAGLGSGIGGLARPLERTLQAAAEVAGNKEAYKEFLRAGASTQGFSVRTPKDAREALLRLQRDGVSLSDVVNPKRWVDALEFIGSVGEQATRLARFKEMRNRGVSAAEAAFEAQDVSLRFRNIGRSTKNIASMTKFWNAKVQGWDKLARMVRNPKTAGIAVGMITAPSLALWTANKDNPEYWQRPQWERNLFWLVPKDDGSGFWRVPKPFEFGYLFASLPERMMDYVAQRGGIASAAGIVAEPGRELARSTSAMAKSTMEGTLPVPDVASLALQLSQGRDWFRDRDIVTRPNLPTGMQMDEQTSALGRALGRVGVSPQKVDFAVGETLGSGGRIGLRALDVVARRAGMDAPDVAVRGKMVPGIPQRFQSQQFARTDREEGARSRLRELDAIWAGYEQQVNSGDVQAARQYLRKNEAALSDRLNLNNARLRLDRIADQRRDIVRNPTLSPDVKREQLDVLRDQADEVSKFIQSYRSSRQR